MFKKSILIILCFCAAQALANSKYLINLDRDKRPWSVDVVSDAGFSRKNGRIADATPEMREPGQILERMFENLKFIEKIASQYPIPSSHYPDRNLVSLGEFLNELLNAPEIPVKNIQVGLERRSVSEYFLSEIKSNLEFLNRPLFSSQNLVAGEVKKMVRHDEQSRKALFKILKVSSLQELIRKVESRFGPCQSELSANAESADPAVR